MWDFVIYLVLETRCRVLHLLDKCYSIKWHPNPCAMVFQGWRWFCAYRPLVCKPCNPSLVPHPMWRWKEETRSTALSTDPLHMLHGTHVPPGLIRGGLLFMFYFKAWFLGGAEWGFRWTLSSQAVLTGIGKCQSVCLSASCSEISQIPFLTATTIAAFCSHYRPRATGLPHLVSEPSRLWAK